MPYAEEHDECAAEEHGADEVRNREPGRSVGFGGNEDVQQDSRSDRLRNGVTPESVESPPNALVVHNTRVRRRVRIL